MKTLKIVVSIISLTSAFSLIPTGIASAQVSMSGGFMETRIDQSSISASVECIINQPINNMKGIQLTIEHLNPGTTTSSIRSLTVMGITESSISSDQLSPNDIGNQAINPLIVINNGSNRSLDSEYSSVSGGLE
ncbi:hypothetical protein GM3708_1383 [Geminocystis sp. NIES-3708]|uniref:hypothetical protein n=1 Tax=Geminocystis sp. NIES-3708 TaxID=1615909 RepID=UPI0005FCC081|nr:hypothetical protein [Geminocystis sp. NIES-3708]BAQ60977.1 hypothetical protein GM3708_1383 [Geminocystis sp. NIES-3708]